jgi:hypothetical protein
MPVDVLHEAIADTEREIFNDAAGVAPEAREAGESGTREPEQIQGWNGESLGDHEMIEQNFRGRDSSGNDRPLQLRQETNEFESAKHQAAALQAENAQLRQMYDPNMKAAAREQREQLRSQLLDDALDPDRADKLIDGINGLNAHRVELDTARVEQSLAAAVHTHGDEFKKAYLNLISQPKGDPLVRAVVQRIWSDPNPGEMLVTMARGGGIPDRSSSDGQPPPFMPGTRTGAPRSSRRTEADEYSERGRSDLEASEAEIWRSLED